MNYRVSGDFRNTLPFSVFPLVEEGESARYRSEAIALTDLEHFFFRSTIDVSLTLRCDLPSNWCTSSNLHEILDFCICLCFCSHATNIRVRVPVPKSTTRLDAGIISCQLVYFSVCLCQCLYTVLLFSRENFFHCELTLSLNSLD